MKKGFTLLELLIVIGILAILATTVVLVINPAELLRKARDSQRMSDLSSLKSAIAFYITETSTVSMGSDSYYYSYVSGLGCIAGTRTATSTASQAVTNAGWIPINFTGLSGGSPIASLPIDPNQSVAGDDPGLYYVYIPYVTESTFELVANMESTYYSGPSGTGDVESNDGGSMADVYETGTKLGLMTATSGTCFK